MSWPLSQDYNEAIQEPRGNFSDAELKTGEAVANPMGIPMPRSGNFADVYEVRCRNGNRWAVKCFTRQVPGLRERYNEISKYLRQAQLPFTVDFHYLEQGIRVRGQWYPVLKMQWVEGFVLNEFVRNNLDKKPILQAMSQIWLRMARRLRAANIAHGDLQHGNVMLVPGVATNALAVKLIDYDGMCVPALASKKSGEVGHPAYQHPERLRTGAYSTEMDRFSMLCIAASLRCLTIGGRSLWERYDTGDNLLFRPADLQAPAQSPLFQELLAIRDSQAQALVGELHRACQATLDAVPLVTDLFPEEKANVTRVSPGAQSSAQGSAWDFSGEDADGSIVRKRRRQRKAGLWGWTIAASAAAVLLAGVGLGMSFLLKKNPIEKKDTPIVSSQPAPNPSKLPQKPAPSKSESPQRPRESESFEDNAPPVNPEPPPPPPVIAWLPPIDPDHDCIFRKIGPRLTIEVPGKDHDLGAERDRMNAPRLLFDAEGDFNALVRVSGEFLPSMNSTVPGKPPVVAAGLVLLVDERTYIRLERLVVYRNQKFEDFGNWEIRQDGKRTFSQTSKRLNGKETYLRLIRTGNQLRGSVRAEGQQWDVLRPITISLPQRVRIGVDAISGSMKPFAPSFDRVLFQQGRSRFARLDWPSLPAAKTQPVVVAPPPRPRRNSDKREVPDERALASAREQIRERFKAAYDRQTGKRELAKQLYDAGFSGFNQPAMQYVALSESSRIAAAAGDLSAAFDAVNILWKRFDVNLLELKCAVLEQAQEDAAKSARNRQIAQTALILVDRGIMNDDYERAERLLKAARSAAAKSDRKTSLEKSANLLTDKLKQRRGDYEKVRTVARALEDKPDDAEANRRMGVYRCVSKSDWEGGLQLLMKGDNKTLAELAEKDLDDPTDAAAQAKLGDRWYDLANKPKTDQKVRQAWQRRASHWYEDALNNSKTKLTQTEQGRVQKRFLQLRKGNPGSLLDASGVSAVRVGPSLILHLRPHQKIATRQWYGRGIEAAVTMVTAPKMPKKHLRLTLVNGAELSVDVTDNRVEWKVKLPSGEDPDGPGVESRSDTFYFDPAKSLVLRYRIASGRIEVWLNKAQVFGTNNRNGSVTGTAPVRLWSDESEVDIASLTVKRIHER